MIPAHTLLCSTPPANFTNFISCFTVKIQTVFRTALILFSFDSRTKKRPNSHCLCSQTRPAAHNAFILLLLWYTNVNGYLLVQPANGGNQFASCFSAVPSIVLPRLYQRIEELVLNRCFFPTVPFFTCLFKLNVALTKTSSNMCSFWPFSYVRKHSLIHWQYTEMPPFCNSVVSQNLWFLWSVLATTKPICIIILFHAPFFFPFSPSCDIWCISFRYVVQCVYVGETYHYWPSVLFI